VAAETQIGRVRTYQRVEVASMEFFKLDSIEWDPEDQEDISFPTFQVKGKVNGKPFESKISLSLEDQEVDMEYISGYNLHDAWSEIPGYDAAELYILINESPAYAEAVDHYGLGTQQGS